MANLRCSLFLIFITLPCLIQGLSSCNGPCNTGNDCSGQLTCINGKCNYDPDVGNHICNQGGSPTVGPSSTCLSIGTVHCGGQTKQQFKCLPPVMSSTPATLFLNDFSEIGDGGDPSECDGKFHADSELVVALSTGWYDSGSRCGKMIRIIAKSGRSVLAKVVDECDSVNGCDRVHAGQPSCDNNIVDGSLAVWKALGLNRHWQSASYLVYGLTHKLQR